MGFLWTSREGALAPFEGSFYGLRGNLAVLQADSMNVGRQNLWVPAGACAGAQHTRDIGAKVRYKRQTRLISLLSSRHSIAGWTKVRAETHRFGVQAKMLCLVRLGVHYGSDAFWAGGIEVALCFLFV